jgi:senataxin
LLGVIMSSNRETVEKKRLFTVTIFREADLPIRIEDEEWRIEPVCTLISELRCFEAMVSVPPHNIALLTALLGQKTSKHTKFPDSDFLDSGSSDDDTEIIVLEPSTAKPRDGSIQEYFAPKIQSQTELLPFRLPWLNETQEKAAQTFLNSKPSSITLIQGPPGTGKTTLLVSVIARYLMKFATVCTSSKNESSRRRIMVCAPTNKAIAVLASRFLASVYPNEDSSTVFNAVMVGDAEKLLVDERNRTVKSNVPDTLPLKSIFVFSWMQGVMDDYRSIKNFFVPGQVRGWEREDLYKLARRLETRLISSLPGMPTSVGKLASKISNSLKRLESGGAAHGIVENIDKVLQQLKDMPQDHIYRELLLSADIIFCTLASAGGLLLRMTSRIDDLIVDEAAAATEPELCIPLHLQPSRLLCVGDPKQLPATLLSRKAVDLGLSKSLQERLMYDCKQQHIMLDVQYRMNPQISSFPSRCFYEDKIQNGENVSSAIYESGPLLMQGRPYAALHVEGVEEQGVGGSYRNEAEARVVVDLIDQLRTRAGSNNPHWHSTEHVRIITFYQAQVGLLKRLLRDRGLGDKIVVATVDSSQGCEADTVIVSFVRSPNTKNAGNEMIRHTAGFLTDDRRMNVALTRAKYQLVCVGNIHGMVRMEGAVTLQELSANAREREVIQTWPLGSRTSNINGKAIHDKLDLFYGECDNRKRPSKKMRW